MTPDPGLAGLLLAGGASRRMGTDKALLVVGGQTLAARGVALLRAVCGGGVLVAPGGRPLGLGLDEVPDAVPGSGPLGGLVAGLERAAAPLVAVLAVDLPLASGPVLRALAAVWDGEDAVLPVVGGRREPLHAVWSAAAAPALRAELAAGRLALHRAAAGLRVRVAGPEVWAAAAAGVPFWHNVNVPADLAGPARGARTPDTAPDGVSRPGPPTTTPAPP